MGTLHGVLRRGLSHSKRRSGSVTKIHCGKGCIYAPWVFRLPSLAVRSDSRTRHKTSNLGKVTLSIDNLPLTRNGIFPTCNLRLNVEHKKCKIHLSCLQILKKIIYRKNTSVAIDLHLNFTNGLNRTSRNIPGRQSSVPLEPLTISA